MSETFLTGDEVAAIQGLPRETPYLIKGVTQSMFSVARHYGGCKYNGEHYQYVPATDELVREDVFAFVMKLRTKPKRGKGKKS